MVEKIWDSPEIQRIYVDLPQNPLRLLNVYVIRTPERNLIIDTGFNRPECREALWAGIEELGLDLSKTAVFLTHLHSDHIGLVNTLADRGVPVYMSAIDYDMYCTLHSGVGFAPLEARFQREGYPPEELALQNTSNQGRTFAPDRPFSVTPVQDEQSIPLGDVRITAIHTPGHTPGHMVLYLPEEQLLFSGDHVLFDITPNIGVWPNVADSLSNYISSLLKIRALPIRATFPAHRESGADVYKRIDQLIEHHGQRLDEIYQAVKAHPGATTYEIAGHITWSARGLGWEQFPPHQKWFAMGETAAHLDYLADREQVLRVDDGQFIRYYPGEKKRN